MTQWLLILGVAVLLWLLFSGRGRVSPQRGVLSFGKSRAREVKEETVNFGDVAGVDEAEEELQEVVDFLRRPERYAALGARIPKGVLLVGPPGTGKTLLARAVAGEASVPFFQISGSDFVEMFVGVGAARVRDMFKKARESAPCIIFIDELDALGKARGAGVFTHPEHEQTLNQLLVEMDGFDASSGVIVMAATNRPEVLDTALLRAGRFDRQILVDRPQREGRRAILDIHVRGVTLGPDVDLDTVAARTPGFVGADLANLVNEAALLAARRGKQAVGMAEFDEAIDRVMLGLKKKGRILSDEEKRIVAYHELGHAVVGEVLPGAEPVEKVSIIPRAFSLGQTVQRPGEDYLLKESELRDRIAVLLGGRAAEMLFVGEPLTGASNDLARATEMASAMVRQYGMSRLGIRTFERPRAAMVNPEQAGSTPRDHGDHIADQIDAEVHRIVEEGLQRATAVLEEHREAVERLVERLLETQQIPGAELREALGLPPRPGWAAETTEPEETPAGGADGEQEAATPARVEEPAGEAGGGEQPLAGDGPGQGPKAPSPA